MCDWREVFGKYGDSRHSLIDALHKLISEYVEWKDLLNYFKKGKIDGYRMRYDNHDKMRYLEWYDNYQYTKHKGYKEIFSISPSDLYTYDYTYEFIEDLEREELIQILSNLGKDIFVKEWSTRGYCQGDYIEGIAFCTKERFTLTLTDEERLLVEERIKAGYYSAESIEKRREEAHKAKMSEKRAEICERYDKKIRQAEAEKKIMLCVFDYGLSTDNVIYYSHTNTLSFNWDSYGEKITQEEFDDFVNKVDRSQLPEGIKFELK